MRDKPFLLILLLLPQSLLVPREYSLSQVQDELALSSARAVDLFLLILLWIGWSIGKSVRHSQTHTVWITDPAILWMGWVKSEEQQEEQQEQEQEQEDPIIIEEDGLLIVHPEFFQE